MRLKSVRIQNFRSFKDETVEFDDHTCLLGANGSGKSNVLHALNVFFGDTQTPGLSPTLLEEEDFHGKDTKRLVEITVTFTDLSEDAQKDFEHYYRQGQLMVSAIAEFESDAGTANVKQYGWRRGIEDFAEFFEAEKDSKIRVGELRDIYEPLRTKCPDLPPEKTKPAMTDALRSYEDDRPKECTLIRADDQFYGVSKGRNLLEKYVQWIFVPAVKDASTEDHEDRNTGIGKLLARTVREKISFDEDIDQIRSDAGSRYEDLLEKSQDALTDISNALTERLREWAHPDAALRLEWAQDREKAVQVLPPFAKAIPGEPGFEGDLSRFGHGFQRAYLLALLQELSGSDAKGGPTLILACEEPELYQHPPQARHLYNVLLELAGENAQVITCTHSPYFVSGEEFESIRLVRKVDGQSRVHKASFEQVREKLEQAGAKAAPKPSGALAKIHQALQPELSEMFFAPKVVFVEGLEDRAYITTYLELLGLWDEYRRLGCHIVPVDGKSAMVQPISIAQCLQIPAFAVFDADGHELECNRRQMHRKDNLKILKLCKVENPDPFPDAPVWDELCVMWHSEIGEVVDEEIGQEQWGEFRNQANKHYGHPPGGLKKNVLQIAKSLEFAWDAGKKSASLEKLCHEIIAFAERHP